MDPITLQISEYKISNNGVSIGLIIVTVFSQLDAHYVHLKLGLIELSAFKPGRRLIGARCFRVKISYIFQDDFFKLMTTISVYIGYNYSMLHNTSMHVNK